MKDTSLRAHFPFFKQPQNASLVYFDNAATTHKPQCVIDAIQEFYLHQNTNVHRSSFSLANSTTNAFEQVRRNISTFLGADSAKQIVFTKGATESINLVAKALADVSISPGSRILVSATEHHANLVPWQQLAKKKDLILDVVPVNDRGIWDIEKGLALITDTTSIVALGMVSNALGSIQPIQPFIEKAKEVGAITLIDAAQAVAHLPVNVQSMDCDFLVFSAHKVYGPTGVGVLYGKSNALASLPPFLSGGEMIEKVSFQDATFQQAPFKFEAGTPNIEGVFGLNAAICFVQNHQQHIVEHERQLMSHLRKQIVQFDDIIIYGDQNNSISTLSFRFINHDSQDIAILLNEQQIALRVGHHCAMPLMETLGVTGTLRVSLSCYNTIDEIDRFIGALKHALTPMNGEPKSAAQSNWRDRQDKQATIKDNPLAKSIKSAKGWDAVYRQIMLAGKTLKRLEPEFKIPEHEVFGCESQVWLKAQLNADHTMSFSADASGKIVRGLLAIILEPIQNCKSQEISRFAFEEYLAHLGIDNHISDSRGNGLRAVVEKIQSLSSNVN